MFYVCPNDNFPMKYCHKFEVSGIVLVRMYISVFCVRVCYTSDRYLTIGKSSNVVKLRQYVYFFDF